MIQVSECQLKVSFRAKRSGVEESRGVTGGSATGSLDFARDDRNWDYSVRSAAIGLMRVARRAGSQVAIIAAAARIRGARVNAIGSKAPTW